MPKYFRLIYSLSFLLVLSACGPDPQSELEDLATKMSFFVISPSPEHWSPFQVDVPGGNIGDFTDRWKWITESILPAFKDLDNTEKKLIATKLKAILKSAQEICK